MFDFFNFKKYKLPEHYQRLINQKDYKIFLKQCIEVLKGLNMKVIKTTDGCLTYKRENGEEAYFYLDNLIRIYVQVEASNKLACIQNHFANLQDRSDAYKYLYKDYEYAKQFIKLLIKHPNNTGFIDQFVHRNDYPDLYTVLTFDFEQQFHYIRRDDAKEWGLDEHVLFQQALENITLENVVIKDYLFQQKFPIYILFDGDFSAASTLLLKEKYNYTIGSFGCLIALPTKGTVFIHPIETPNVLAVIEAIFPEVDKFYNEDPGTITTDFYWYYEGLFEVFPTNTNEDHSISIRLPKTLDDLFNLNTELFNS